MTERKISKPLAMAGAFFAVWGAIFLLGGFVAWDWNPGNWSEVGRGVLALLGTVWGGIAAMFAGDSHD